MNPETPISVIADSVAMLERAGVINPPDHPGLLGQVEGYDLPRVLGRGGMGVVFLAREKQSGMTVALKTLLPVCQEEARLREKFVRTAKHQRQLVHPNIVPVLEIRELKTGAFFTMPFHERGSLAETLKPGVPLEPGFVLRVSISVAEALMFAHAKGITHRDIKPGNILIDAEGAIRVADFGLARTLFNDELLELDQEQCEGTAPYMSPVVAAGEAEDTRCDIYALGAVMYEMLTGRVPYAGKTLSEVREKIKAGPPESILKVNPQAEPRLAAIAEEAMAREHKDRYAHMRYLLADLREAEAGPALDSGRKKKRVRWLVAACGVLLALLAIIPVLWKRDRPAPSLMTASPTFTSSIKDWRGCLPIRWRNVPAKDLVVLWENHIYIYSTTGEQIDCWPPSWTGTPRGIIQGAHPFRPPGGDLDRISTCIADGTNLAMLQINSSMFELPTRFRAEGFPDHSQAWPGHASILRWLELQEGQTKILYTTLSHPYAPTNFEGRKFRSVIAYNYETGAKLWNYEIGPIVDTSIMADVDLDGQPNLVVGTSASDNGYVGQDGIADSNACVMAFSSSGTLLCKSRLTPEFTHWDVFPLRRRGQPGPRVAAFLFANSVEELNPGLQRCRVVLFDANGEEERHYEPDAWLRSVAPVDLDGDGNDELACTDNSGAVHLLDTELKPTLRKSVFPEPELRPGTADHFYCTIVGTGRFSAKEEASMVVRSYVVRAFEADMGHFWKDRKEKLSFENERVTVLDQHLKEVANYSFGGTNATTGAVLAEDMDGDGIKEIVYLKDTVQILKVP